MKWPRVQPTGSYGIHVGQLAGLPPAVTARAEQVLEKLESGDQAGGGTSAEELAGDLPLFSAMARPQAGAGQRSAAGPSELERELAGVNPDELTPRHALDLIYRLKSISRGTGDE